MTRRSVTRREKLSGALDWTFLHHFVCCGMPVVCCRCNASGRCKNCACKKAGRECLNCLPRRRGHCENSTPLAPTVSDANGLRTTMPPTQDTSNERIERGESGVIENVRHLAINDNNMVDDMTDTVTSIPETQMPTQSETRPNLEQDVEDLPMHLHTSVRARLSLG